MALGRKSGGRFSPLSSRGGIRLVNPHRAEIEQMLRAHKRSHFAQTFALMEAGLSDQEISIRMNVSPQRSTRVRKAVDKTLADEPIAAKTWANIVAAIYRELLNYPMSDGLRQHINTRIAQYQTIDPTIPSAALGNLVLGSQTRPRPERPQGVCADCRTEHSGDCW